MHVWKYRLIKWEKKAKQETPISLVIKKKYDHFPQSNPTRDPHYCNSWLVPLQEEALFVLISSFLEAAYAVSLHQQNMELEFCK